ncbi:hypothetical protein TeGR_g190 [Tetraparma gracilis]|uniref:Uncharacterized protein n=1 Tax=Tetraparma gracilis TaxID=2962635 RepID=A0ABQ6N1Q0_9STRA|nr:hypothetical protein TeGR_g190 [Tetraparma gracilis]
MLAARLTPRMATAARPFHRPLPSARSFSSSPGSSLADRTVSFLAGFGACSLGCSFLLFDELRAANDKVFAKLSIKK